MNVQLKKLGFTTSHIGSTQNFSQHEKQQKSQLFLPEQLQAIKLNQLRSKRKQLEDKLKLVTNRISYRRKKQEQQLRRYIRTEEKSRIVSETKNFKKVNMIIKEELNQKKVFEERKKAKQVQDYRMTANRRLSLIYQSVRDRKLMDSQKVRNVKKVLTSLNQTEQQTMQALKQDAMVEIKQKHEQIQKMREQQMSKRKCYWLQKRLSFQQNILQEVSLYENQIQDYYKKIEELRKNQEILKEKQQHAIEVLKCAQQNYELLKQS